MTLWSCLNCSTNSQYLKKKFFSKTFGSNLLNWRSGGTVSHSVGTVEDQGVKPLESIPAFNLTFQKWFVSFHIKINSKTDLECRSPWFRDKKLYPRSSKLALNSIFNFFYLMQKYQLCILYQKTKIKNKLHQRTVSKIIWEYLYLNYAE